MLTHFYKKNSSYPMKINRCETVEVCSAYYMKTQFSNTKYDSSNHEHQI